MNNQLVFKNHTITPVLVNNQPFLRVPQIEDALNYQAGKISQIYNRHADEFTPDMSFLTTIDTPGGKQQVRVFSLRGCHLLAMFSKTPVAKEFRRWVLDLIEQHNATPALPDMKSLGGMMKSCAAAAMRTEFEKIATDMVYGEKFKQLVRSAMYDFIGETMINEEMLPKWRALFQRWVRDSLAVKDTGLKDWCSSVLAQLIEAEAKALANEKFNAYAKEAKKALDKYASETSLQAFIKSEVKKLYKEN